MTTFANSWQGASVGGEDNELEPPSDGKYQVALDAASAFTSKKGDDYVALTLRDVDSNYTWKLLLGFRTQGAASVTKTACANLGVDVEDVVSFEQLGDELLGRVGNYYEATVKTNGEYRNTYIDGPSTPLPRTDVPVAEPDPLPVGGGDDDEDIPFLVRLPAWSDRYVGLNPFA